MTGGLETRGGSEGFGRRRPGGACPLVSVMRKPGGPRAARLGRWELCVLWPGVRGFHPSGRARREARLVSPPGRSAGARAGRHPSAARWAVGAGYARPLVPFGRPCPCSARHTLRTTGGGRDGPTPPRLPSMRIPYDGPRGRGQVRRVRLPSPSAPPPPGGPPAPRRGVIPAPAPGPGRAVAAFALAARVPGRARDDRGRLGDSSEAQSLRLATAHPHPKALRAFDLSRQRERWGARGSASSFAAGLDPGLRRGDGGRGSVRCPLPPSPRREGLQHPAGVSWVFARGAGGCARYAAPRVPITRRVRTARSAAGRSAPRRRGPSARPRPPSRRRAGRPRRGSPGRWRRALPSSPAPHPPA